MPANPKYLTNSKIERFSKITAGVLGGFALSLSLHVAITTFIDKIEVIVTAYFSGFLLWAGFMILAFLSKKGSSTIL